MNECPVDSLLIETYFIDGPLGVTLKRRPNDGAVFVYNLVEGSQSIGKNIELQDELWSVGSTFLGLAPFYKADWDNLISVIQNSKRPLRIVWRRRKPVLISPTTSINELQSQPSLESSDAYTPVSETSSIGIDNNYNNNNGQREVTDNNNPSQPLYEQFEMKELASRLIFPTNKDKSSKQSSSSSSSSADYRQPNFILRSNQRVLITSHVLIESKLASVNNNSSNNTGGNVNFFNTLWGVGSGVTGMSGSSGVGGNKRFLILLTDTLLVTIPLNATGGTESSDTSGTTVGAGVCEGDSSNNNMLRVEHIINLISCKLSYPSTNMNNSRHPTIDSSSSSSQLTPLQHFQQSVIDTTQQLASTKNNITTTTTIDKTTSNGSSSFMITFPLGQIRVTLKSSEERDFWFNKMLNTASELTGYDNQYHLNNSNNNSDNNNHFSSSSSLAGMATSGMSGNVTGMSETDNNSSNTSNNKNNTNRDYLINSNEHMLTTNNKYTNNNTTNTTTTRNSSFSIGSNNNTNTNNSSPSPTHNNNNSSSNSNYRYRLHEAVINNNESKLSNIITEISSSSSSSSSSMNNNKNTTTTTLDIDETNDEGYTALHYACIFQYHHLISLLYNANANICYVDSNGYSPLHWSALLLDYKALNILLSTIIDPDMNDNEDRTPLLIACSFGHNHHNRSLVCCNNTHDHDDDDGDDEISSSNSNNNNNNRIKKKLKKVNSKKKVQHKDTNNNNNNNDTHTTTTPTTTCTKIISSSMRKALVKSIICLLSRRADPSTADIENIPALHYLSASWQYEAIQLLTKAEVNVFRMSSSSSSNSGSGFGNVINDHNSEGIMQSALHYAVMGSVLKMNEFSEICSSIQDTKKKALLSHATSKNIQKKILNDMNNNTTTTNQMIVSVKQYNKYKYDIKYGVKTMHVLLLAGCRPNRRNSEGKVPLQLLLQFASIQWKKSRILEAVCVLILYGARIELLDPSELIVLKKLCGRGSSGIGSGSNNNKNKGKNKSRTKSSAAADDDGDDDNDESKNDSNSNDDDDDDDDSSGSKKSINDNSDNDDNSDDEDEEDQFGKDLVYMTSIDKAIEGWVNKSELPVDTIGLRAGSLKIEDDGNGDETPNKPSSSSSSCVFPNDGKEKCILCSTGFTLFKRQHHCRLCNILCCDDCSRKRVIISHSKKERVCDSCYNIATCRLQERQTRQLIQKKNADTNTAAVMATISGLTLTTGGTGSGTSESSDEEDEHDNDDDNDDDDESDNNTNTNMTNMKSVYTGKNSKRKTATTKRASESGSSDNGSNKSSARGNQSPLTITTGITAAASAVDSSARSLLFGHAGNNNNINSNSSMGSKSPTVFTTTKFTPKPSTTATATANNQKQAQQNVSQSIHTMNEINERLKKRGEKLSEIGDRTEKLSNQANEFAKMAKELKAQQQRRNSFLGFLG